MGFHIEMEQFDGNLGFVPIRSKIIPHYVQLRKALDKVENLLHQVSDIDKQIATQMEDLLEVKFFGDALYSQQLFNQVKKEVHRDIVNNGMPLRQLSDVDSMTKSALGYVLNGETGYGYSKYTFSNFVNLKMKSGEYGKQQHFVLHPAEKYYGLPLESEDNKGAWMNNAVMERVKNSKEFFELVPTLICVVQYSLAPKDFGVL